VYGVTRYGKPHITQRKTLLAVGEGSRARNTHRTDSDADVVVLLRGSPGKFFATKLAMDDLAYDVLLNTGIRIQPLPVWESEWSQPENYSNPWLLKNIANEGIRL
jgi:antitoxin ChpS